MAVKAEDKIEMPDQDIVDEEDESSEDEEPQGDDDQSEDEEEDEVDIKGTKFNLSRVAEDAQVDDEDSDEEEEDEDDDDDEGAKANQEESGSDDEATSGKSGWADAMAKVLNMGKDSESAPGLLSKAKLDSSAPAAEGDAAGQPREAVRRALKKEIEDTGRVRPDVVKDRAREKALVKLATRGVVQLFNAVRDQQKDLKSQLNAVGQSTRKREQVYKSIDKEGFLDVLSGNKRNSGRAEQQQQPVKKKAKANEKEEEASSWSVIKDDYMLGAKMKDWDKESDTEEVA